MAKAITGSGSPTARNNTTGVRVRATGKATAGVPYPGAVVSATGVVGPPLPITQHTGQSVLESTTALIAAAGQVTARGVEDIGSTAELFALSVGLVGVGVVRTKLAIWDTGSPVEMQMSPARVSGVGVRTVANIKPVNIVSAAASVVNGGVSATLVGTGALQAVATPVPGIGTTGHVGTSILASSIATILGSSSTPPASDYPTTFDYYLSPTGNNANSGTSPGAPWKTFAKAFSTMGGGKRLGLLDGTYSVAAGTGCINFNTANSAQPPSGNAAAFTEICSVNPGGAVIDGTGDYNGTAVWIGRSTRKDSYIKLRGFKALTGIVLYNTTRCFVKDVGAKYGISIGTNDVASGATLTNTYNLVEDCWAWGAGVRLLSSNYQAHNNVWRRFVLRKDGAGASGSGNPNVVFTVYNSKNCSVQNVFSVDRLADPSPYSDFATAQHDGVAADKANFYLGGNEWLGCGCVNSQDASLNFEGDTCEPGLVTWTIKHFFAHLGGVNLSAASFGPPNASVNIENITCLGDQIRVKNMAQGGYVRNSVVANSTTYGVNVDSPVVASYIDYYNNASGNTTGSIANGLTSNPLAGSPAPIKYPLRIEAGSFLKGAGFGGGDIGATIEYRYGLDGTFYGDPGYNTLTSTPLWPYPNEARIKADMAADSTRGFCAPGETLTHYLWNRLGNGSPY